MLRSMPNKENKEQIRGGGGSCCICRVVVVLADLAFAFSEATLKRKWCAAHVWPDGAHHAGRRSHGLSPSDQLETEDGTRTSAGRLGSEHI